MPTIHYEVAGNGYPIVLLHGIGSNSKSWRRQLAEFSSRFTVVAWDAPGYGQSADPGWHVPTIRGYSDALRELFESLGFTSAVVLGHSLGGVIAQDFYRAYPAKVRALILADTTQGDGGQPTEIRETKLASRLRMIQTMKPAELAQNRAPRLFSKRAAPEQVREAVSIMSEVREVGYAAASITLSKTDLRGVLNKIKIPLLMVWGADDEITPQWKKYPKRARVEIIQNAGHLCYMEQPQIFNGIVLDFLETTLASSSTTHDR